MSIHSRTSDTRICFIGDSLVFGAGDPECLGWPGRLCVDARRKGYDASYYNLGIRGETSVDIASRWREDATQRLFPPYRSIQAGVVFSFGTNDTVIVGGQRRVPIEQSLESTTDIIREANRMLPVLMVGPAPIADTSRHAEVKRLSDEFGSICRAERVPFLDVFDQLAESEAWMTEVAAVDGAHPGASGYAILAELVGKWSAWANWFE